MEALIKRSVELPLEIERLILAQGEKKDQIYDLIQRKRDIEDEVAGVVASDRQHYPNEESRRAEIARRLRENGECQGLEEQIRTARRELTHLEASLGKAQGEIGSVNALINLLAAAIHSGRADIEQMITNIINEMTSNQNNTETQAVEEQTPATPRAETPQNEANTPHGSRTRRIRNTSRVTEQQNGENLSEAQVKVLEASVNDRGTTRAWCEVVGGQQRVAVYGKNGNGEKLRAAAGTGRTLKVKYRELDAGWFAVAITSA